MNRAQLISTVAQKTQLSKKDSEMAVMAVLETIEETLAAGERVQLVGFGMFEVKERAAKMGKNPQTGELMEIPSNMHPVFRAGKVLKEKVRK